MKIEEGVGQLLDYEKRLRLASSRDEYGHRLIAGLADLVGFQTAALTSSWGAAGQRVTHVSDSSQVDQTAPLVSIIRRVAAIARNQEEQVAEYARSDFPEDLRDDLDSLAPPFVVAVKISESHDAYADGMLILLRVRPLKAAQKELLTYLSGLWVHGLRAVVRGRRRQARVLSWTRAVTLFTAAALLATPLIPARLSVTAPAEVVAESPVVVTAPLSGVIDEIKVQPRQLVSRGDILFNFDARELRNAFDTAQQEALVARSALRAVEQASFQRTAERARLAELRTQADLAELRAEQARARLERSEVRAPLAGEALIDRPSQWSGRPVQIGEKILELAQPGKTKLLIRVPVADAIRYEIGNPVRFYMSNRPFDPVEARLSKIDFEPSLSPSGILSFELSASFPDEIQTSLRLGAQGNAKVIGPESNLFLYLFRRPIAWLSRALAL